MNKISHDEARRLLEKFLDGATNNAEERRLHEYFLSGNVADDLKPYAGMMDWFADLDGSGKREDTAKKLSGRRRMLLRRWMTGVAAAAAVTLLVATGMSRFGLGEEELDSELMEMYAGSYMMRNGKKVTDLKKVLPTILETERMATKMRIEARSEFTRVQAEMQHQMWEECDSVINNSMAAEELWEY